MDFDVEAMNKQMDEFKDEFKDEFRDEFKNEFLANVLPDDEEKERCKEFIERMDGYYGNSVHIQEPENLFWAGYKVKLGSSVEGVYAILPITNAKILVISKQYFKGKEYLDIRIFQKGLDSTNQPVFYPTNRGLKLAPWIIPAFFVALYRFLAPQENSPENLPEDPPKDPENPGNPGNPKDL